ncbi:hypothetical protein TPHA_0P00760 [Tetrapisispora phaffii CBS 4417]|uniref:Golgi to ER traffic protein 2 n=1 Tax=Tetrapisispora phaffii (strain ATCC 24235 / CBS 4417 / NBRC 1672 / NRRL Y-8282 / UCD 70-5) TaxID=1071381 RepID=G8C256_TETPH|nr:hypothetical protein TPHA_0P00760 [Tetrapisispora phaffii CBS 4417]CCE66234.1 hypothetical protein TPHA_0P00760 [Tetrapisispora phaffii CBS 4417]
MSELSEAEKRQLLRERRQRKFKNGGASSRLNQITGQNKDSQLSTESPLDVQTAATKNTIEMDDLFANVKKASVENKAKQAAIKKKTEKEQIQNPVNPELEMYKHLAEKTQDDGSSTPEFFSMLQSMQQSFGEGTATPSSQVFPVDQANLDYYNYKLNNMKAVFILIKWLVFLLPYIYFVTRPKLQQFNHQFSLSALTDSRNFFMVFLSFEIVAMSAYLQKLKGLQKGHKIDPIQNAGKFANLIGLIPEGILPINNLKGKAVLCLQHLDLLSLFLTDLAFVIIMIGIVSVF